MTDYVVGKIDEIAEGRGIAIEAGGRQISVFRIADAFFAIANSCPHKGASLCDGEVLVEKRMVRCPWHHWNWQIDTGRLEADPRRRLRTYPVLVDGDDVIVRT
jgi:3-phenylpropionate/trans-cinnamate dioxygenase ferredoxin subunit